MMKSNLATGNAQYAVKYVMLASSYAIVVTHHVKTKFQSFPLNQIHFRKEIGSVRGVAFTISPDVHNVSYVNASETV